MQLLVVLTLLGATDASGGRSIPPAPELALKIAEATGATLRSLAVEPDETVTPEEASMVESALLNTSLFDIVSPESADAVVRLHRLEQTIVATVVRGADERLWVGVIDWPTTPDASVDSQPAPPPPDTSHSATSEPTPKSSPALGPKLESYRERQLKIRPVFKSVWATPTIVPGFQFYGRAGRRRGGRRGARRARPIPNFGPYPYGPAYGPAFRTWGTGYLGVQPVAIVPNGWAVVQGEKRVLDELEFARIIEDEGLLNEVRHTRKVKKRRWALGFGSAAVAALASGAALTAVDFGGGDTADRNRDTGGISLIAVGITAAIMTALTPRVGRDPVQSMDDAQDRVDDYNAELRRALGLRLKDVEDDPELELDPNAASPEPTSP